MAEKESTNRFIRWLQQQPRPFRIVIFFAVLGALIVALFYGVAAIYFINVANLPRVASLSLDEDNYQVREFVTFEDEQAYIGALAMDGSLLYMGSYATGAIWSATPDSGIRELPQTRNQLNSIVGLDAQDGILTILDNNDPLLNDGGAIWQYVDSDDSLTQIAELLPSGSDSIAAPNDIAVDSNGNIYVVDIAQERIWKFSHDENGEVIREQWWRAPANGNDPAPTGLAYSATDNHLLVVDIDLNTVHAIALDADDPQAATTELYRYTGDESKPGFNGIDVSAAGDIYLAGLDQNRVARLNQETNDLDYLAGAFRGSSDVAYDDIRDRIFVNNWDQRWLRPVGFVFTSRLLDPRLPFSVDVIEAVNE